MNETKELIPTGLNQHPYPFQIPEAEVTDLSTASMTALGVDFHIGSISVSGTSSDHDVLTYISIENPKDEMRDLLQIIPEEMKVRDQWVLWRYEWNHNENKPRKVPYQPNGRKAKTNTPTTWSTFNKTVDSWYRGRYDGIGFVFTSDDPYIGVDFDDIIDEKIDPEYLAHILNLDSYTEITPSGSGVHCILKGKLPPQGRKKGKIEMYSTHRFFTVTGMRISDASVIEERQEQIDALHRSLFTSVSSPAPTSAPSLGETLILSDGILLDKAMHAKNGAKFQRLWEGDHTGYASVSEADLALCSLLSFWTRRDVERIDRLYRESGLFRQKWDEPHAGSGKTYGEMTIERAIENPAVYQPKSVQLEAEKDFDFILTCFHDNEFGDAMLLTSVCRDEYLYDNEADRWYIYEGNWMEDNTLSIREMARRVLQAEYQSLLTYLQQTRISVISENDPTDVDDDGQKKLIASVQRRINDLNTLKRMTTILTIVQGGQFFGIRGNEWDRDPWVLGTEYELIDLRTGTSRTTRPDDHVRKYAPTLWKGIDEPAPRWEIFVHEIMGEDGLPEKPISGFLQRLLGYSLLGVQREAILPILYGARGRNGKETLFEIIRFVLGELAMPVQKELLMDSSKKRGGQASPELYDLNNVRIAWISETADGEQLATDKAKYLSGNGTIAARQVWARNISRFEQSHQLFVFTNHKPRASADDDALWGRLLLVPFEQSFVDDPTEPYQRKIDRQIREKLKAEASGILGWLVRGCLEYLNTGLAIPQRIKALTSEYRRGEDLMSQFFEENVVLRPDSEEYVQSSALYLSYTTWAIENGYRPMSHKRFAEKLPLNLTKVRRKDANYYKGIRLISRSES